MRRPRFPSGGLWHHADFMKLWTGQSISEVGSQVSALAIPWIAAVGLHASPIAFSILGMLGFLPFILFALPAGVWVDRLRRRPILIGGDAARAVLLAIIPILWALGALHMWQLLVLQFVIGIFTVFFDVAYQSYLPALVERKDLIDGNAKIQLTVSVAQVAGPSAAGALIAAVTAPYAIAIDAVSFVVSALFMLRIRKPESVPGRAEGAPKPKMWPEVKEGLRWVVGHPWLRAIATCTGTSNFFGTITFAIALLYFTRLLHLSAFEVGVVFGVGSVGSVVAALVANRMQQALGVGRAILLPIVVAQVGLLAYPLAPRSFPLPVLIAGNLLFGFGAVAYNIAQVSLRQAITPERLQGRMNAAMRWIVWGTIPLGTMAGGGIATAWGLRAALWVGGIGSLFTFLPIALSSVRSIRELPEPVDEPPALSIEPLIGQPGGATVAVDA